MVMTCGLWQRRFGGDNKLVGQPLELNGVSYTLVGILPRTSSPRSQRRNWQSLLYLMRIPGVRTETQ